MIPKEDGTVQVACMTHHGHDHDCVNDHRREQNQCRHLMLVVDLFPEGVHRVSGVPDHSTAHGRRIAVAPLQNPNQTLVYQTETIGHRRQAQWAHKDKFDPPAVDTKDDPDSPSLVLTSDVEEASFGLAQSLCSRVELRDRNRVPVGATSYAPSRCHARVRSPGD